MRDEARSIDRKAHLAGVPMNVCMLAYSYYETDNRIRRYAESLRDRGDTVDVIALKRKGESDFDVVGGVNVYRIQERVLNEKKSITYLFRVMKFLVRSTLVLTRRHKELPYDAVHVHSPPDFEVFAALFIKCMGTKVILDIHDIVPEFYAAKFGATNHSLVFRCLVWVEKLSILFSDHVIISNHLWYERLISRSVTPNKCTVLLNYPDNALFCSRGQKLNGAGEFKIIYPGTLNWHQGVDIAVKAFSRVADQIPNARFYIYGDGPQRPFLAKLISELGLDDKVFLKGLKSLDEIARIMADADLGVVPKRNDAFGGDAFSTKTFEFMALGVPIVLSRTRIDAYYFNDSVVKFFDPENTDDLASSFLELANNEKKRKGLIENASNFIAEFRWDRKRTDYWAILERLVGKNVSHNAR